MLATVLQEDDDGWRGFAHILLSVSIPRLFVLAGCLLQQVAVLLCSLFEFGSWYKWRKGEGVGRSGTAVVGKRIRYYYCQCILYIDKHGTACYHAPIFRMVLLVDPQRPLMALSALTFVCQQANCGRSR